MTKTNCAECGKGEVESRKVQNFATMVRGVPFVVPEATVGFCSSCGAKVFDPKEIRRWQALFESEQLGPEKLLSAGEITELRGALGLQVMQFARLLGTTRQSVYNWERENRTAPQLRLADLLLKLIREYRTNGAVDVVEFLRTQAGLDQEQRNLRPARRATRIRARGRIRASTRRESCDFDQLFGPAAVPRELPRLRML
jgi:putative zinc finger/helix-turn-helix YgiT family protein